MKNLFPGSSAQRQGLVELAPLGNPSRAAQWLLATAGRVVPCLAMALVGVSACSKAPSAATADADSIVIIADGRGFTPSQVSVKKGGPGKLRFERKSDETCATEVVFPDLNIKQPLPLNQIVEIAVPTTATKTYAFTCGMGMYKSSVVVN